MLRLLPGLLGILGSPQLLQSIAQGSVRGGELGIKRNGPLVRGCGIAVSPQRLVIASERSECIPFSSTGQGIEVYVNLLLPVLCSCPKKPLYCPNL